MEEAPEGPAVSESRRAILGALRKAVGRDEAEQGRAEAAVRRRLASPMPHLLPERGQIEPEARVRLFVDMARAVNADVQQLDSLADVPGAVSTYLRDHNQPQRVVVAPDPVLDQAGWASQPLLRVRRGGALPEDTAAVTLAPAGVAETGTLLLTSAAERPALLAFLPETSVVVLFAGDIDGAYEQSWARLRDTLGEPPRSVNLITGPSRTGDIAQKIELGAHGPKRLLILVIDEDPA
jgi:L-lactate dehydrogenase complex protein LldG